MIEFANLTKKRIDTRVLRRIAGKLFRENFELSVVFATPVLMRKLNKNFRSKDKVANVLSFLLEKNKMGEIFININEKNIPFLFIHASLHLLGYGHKHTIEAKIMEAREKKLLNSLNIIKS